MKKFAVLMMAVFILAVTAFGTAWAAPDVGEEKPMLRAAIFVQNRAGEALHDKIDVLNDLITTRLTEKGFSIIDRNDVVAKFRESRESDAAVKKNIRMLDSLLESGKSDATVEYAITGASALRISQMIGADYLIFATINSIGHETRRFKGQGTVYGTDNAVTVYTLRIALKVLEGNQGGTVYGDVVTASERVAVVERLEIESSDILNKLLDAGAVQVAENIGGKIERIRNVKVKSIPTVEFTINANVEGAVVELDGAAIGSVPGRFNAAPGLHQLRVTKQWLKTWERTVNIFPNQVLNVTLELSDEGIQRFMTMEQFKHEMDKDRKRVEMEMKERETGIGIAKEQSEAEAYATKQIAEGEKKRLEESYERIEGDIKIIYNK